MIYVYVVIHYTLVRTMDVSFWYVCDHSLHIRYARWMSLIGVISSDMICGHSLHIVMYVSNWSDSSDMYVVIHYTLVRTMDVSNWSNFIWYVCGHSLHMWMSIIGVISSDMYVVIHYTLVHTMDVSNWSDFIWYVCGHSLHDVSNWSDFIW